MKKIVYLLLFLPFFVKAQDRKLDFKFGQVSEKDLAETSYQNDTTADAYYINDYGQADLNYDDSKGFYVDYYKHARIKIFNKNAFDEATIEELLYRSSGIKGEELRDLKAATFYLDNGSVRQVDITKDAIVDEKVNEHYNRVKFTLPHIENNCIIEYSYIVNSPYYFNLHAWNFQSFIPKKKSLFRALIPANFDFNAALVGRKKLDEQNGVVLGSCLSWPGGSSDCSDLSYGMNNIPAFKREEYMTNPKNFLSAIKFELISFTAYGRTDKYTKTWDDVYKELRFDGDFWPQFKRNNDLFKEQIDPIKKEFADHPLALSHKVYDLVKNWYNWNGFRGMETQNGVKTAFKDHTGNIADINLSLIGALQYAGIDVEPVLVSTRENGLPTEIYPVISDFDYVIAKVNIGDKSYLLDASDKDLSFGLLRFSALNGKGRAIGKDSSYWVDLTPTRKDKTITQVKVELKEDGKFYGTLTKYFSDYAAVEERKEIKKYSTIDEYITHLDERQHRLKIKNYKFNNLDSLDKPLEENLEIEIDGFDDLNVGKLVMNPFLFSKYSENPFKLKERDYPVDFGTPIEETYLLSLTLPNGFHLVNQPTDTGLALPLNGGKYVFSAMVNQNTINITQNLSLKPIFQSNEYPYLKELFNKVVQNNNVDLILEKK